MQHQSLQSTVKTPPHTSIGLREHLAFLFGSVALLLFLMTLLRLALLLFNHELLGNIGWSSVAEAFFNGIRFDARLIVYICIPSALVLAYRPAMIRRTWQRWWLGACACLVILLGMIELNFYREFHQRLNTLVFQYLQEDPATVLRMLWYGFPVLRLLLVWGLLTATFCISLSRIDRFTRSNRPMAHPSRPTTLLLSHGLVLLLCVLLSVLAARGTLRQGPPLRWGDAFTTDSVFTNHLGLNGVLSLYTAAKSRYSGNSANIWKPSMPAEQAIALTRELLLTEHEQLIDQDTTVLRRDLVSPPNTHLPIRNVVIILMESFAGRFVGALGSNEGITPHFDRLAEEGLLFRRFFANGTHTHQGMFASMACFPNLPGFEYLMQTPEGGNQFSGLPQLLSVRGYDDLYIYNGDFAWDNQRGFFSNQGMTQFIGRHDFIDPIVFDSTWGVSDQDMFDRAAEELSKQDQQKPFYALLQTLSNHTPYAALPEELPVKPVTGHGSLDLRLTAMRYSDWALGQFFEKARTAPYYDETLFVVVGDHGFGAHEQVTEMDLYRFHVPLLLIAPGIQPTFGSSRETVGSQVDLVPTIIGRLGGHLNEPVRHQCWGRDLLSLPANDSGFAIIKPSGGDQTVAMLKGDRILVHPKGMPTRFYHYQLGRQAHATLLPTTETDERLNEYMRAYVQTATSSLLGNTAGVVDSAVSQSLASSDPNNEPDQR